MESLQNDALRIMDMVMNRSNPSRPGEEGGDSHLNIHINVNQVDSPNRVEGRLNVIRRLLGYITASLNELDRIPNPETTNPTRQVFTADVTNANTNTDRPPNPEVTVNANSSDQELQSSLISPLVNSWLHSTMNMLGMPMGVRINDLQFQQANSSTASNDAASARPAAASASIPTANDATTNNASSPSANAAQNNYFEILRELMEETRQVQQRLDRHLGRMSEGLRPDTELSQEQLTTLQRDHRFISRVTHHIAHVYHLLSDLRVNFAQRDRNEITLFAQDTRQTGRPMRRTMTPMRTMSETRRPQNSQQTPPVTRLSTQTPPASSVPRPPNSTTSAPMPIPNLPLGMSGSMIFSSTPIVVMARSNRSPVNLTNAQPAPTSSPSAPPNTSANPNQSNPSQASASPQPQPTGTNGATSSANPASGSTPFSFVSFEAAHPSSTSMGHVLDPFLRCNSHWVYPEMREVLDISLVTVPNAPSAQTPASNPSSATAQPTNSQTSTADRASTHSRSHIQNLFSIISQHLTESEIVRAFTELNFATFSRPFEDLRNYARSRMFAGTSVPTADEVTNSVLQPIQRLIERIFVSQLLSLFAIVTLVLTLSLFLMLFADIFKRTRNRAILCGCTSNFVDKHFFGLIFRSV
jgi:hypothetical protein